MEYLQDTAEVLEEYINELRERPESTSHHDAYKNISRFLSITGVEKWVRGDAEDFHSHKQYTNLFESLLSLDKDYFQSIEYLLSPTSLKDSFKLELRFKGETSQFAFEITSDWLNDGVIHILNQLLERVGSHRFFYDTIPTKYVDQSFTYVLVSNETYNELINEQFAIKIRSEEIESDELESNIDEYIDDINFIMESVRKSQYERGVSETEINHGIEQFYYREILSALKMLKKKLKTQEEFNIIAHSHIKMKRLLYRVKTETDLLQYQQSVIDFISLAKSI